MKRESSLEEVAGLLRRCLESGARVEIDGLGQFRRRMGGSFTFVPDERPRVFLAYVVEDAPAVDRLYHDLTEAGFDPWLDRRKLLAGQNWPRAIDRAISTSDIFLACFSPRAVLKRGRFQAELRYALDCASHVPLDQIWFVPVRLEDCALPARITQQYQYVDLFPDWDAGVARLTDSMRRRLALG